MGVKWHNSLLTFQSLAPLAKGICWGALTLGGMDVDMILHAGDLAYAFGNFTMWNMWFERAQNVAAYVPYMVSPGNRDEEQIIEERFRMPANLWSPMRHNFYYSFDYLWVHVISISIKDDYSVGSDQYRWLEQDLQQARARIISNNDIRWIILMGHTPLYSSSDGHTGGNKELKLSIEGLLYKYGVTLAIWGDDHVYERSYPLFNDVPDVHSVYEPTAKKVPVFIEPNKTIHLLAGTGGIDLDGWLSASQPEWSAYREKTNGFLTIDATKNSCRVKFIRLQDGSVADEFLIMKAPHSQQGSFSGIGWLFLPVMSVAILYYIRTKPKRFSM